MAGLVGAQLAFDQTWSRLLAGILVALAVLYGAPPGRPRVAWRPRVRRRRKRRGHRHSYYVS